MSCNLWNLHVENGDVVYSSFIEEWYIDNMPIDLFFCPFCGYEIDKFGCTNQNYGDDV
ncbi:MAG: hypothetical protein ACOCZ5_03745 [bacterium]